MLRSERVVVGTVLVVLLLTGPVVGLDFTEKRGDLGDGTATVDVIQPTRDTLYVTEGRFGTKASYLRIPDLVVDIGSIEGRPRLVYTVAVPELGIEKRSIRVVDDTGRTRLQLSDRAIRDWKPRTYRGYVTVQVQSFTGDKTVLNRSIRVKPS